MARRRSGRCRDALRARAPPSRRSRRRRAMTGAVGWLRANLLSDAVQHRADRSDRALLLVWVVPELVKFLIIDAVWNGADRDACLRGRAASARSAPAGRSSGSGCRISSTAPIRSRERWRVDVFFVAAGDRRRLDAVARTRRGATSARSISSSCCRSSRSSCCTACAAIGLPPVDTALWGGVLVTIVVASVGIVVSLPIGILLALGRRSRMPAVRLFSVIFIEFVRGVPLITVLFMASVMLPLFVPEQLVAGQAAARAGRHRAVRLGLHGRGGARRPAGDPEGPVRGRHGGRPGLLADDAAHHPAAGAQDHHPEHRQHLSSACSRTRRWSSSSASSISCTTIEVVAHRSELGDAGDLARPATRSRRSSI